MHRWLIYALLTLLSVSVQAQGVVRIYNWEDYIDRGILDDFTNETGIDVVYDAFDSHEALEAKLLAGGTGYDVVFPSHFFVSRQIPVGMFQPLDKTKLPNLRHTWPWINQHLQAFDPGNTYSLNYMWGTVGIGYNEDMIQARFPNAPVDSWVLALDPQNLARLADCGVYFPESAEMIIPLVMHYLGIDPDSKNLADVERAGQHLLTLRPHIRGFYSWEQIDALANGEICLAIGLSGDISQAAYRAMEAEGQVSIYYSIPQEGSELWFDQMAIPADAPNPDHAHTFLNYMLRPEVMARASHYVFFANGNLASQDLIEPDMLSDPTIYPDASTRERLFVVRAFPPPEQRILNQVWNRVQLGQ